MVQQLFTIIISLALAYSGRDVLGVERFDCQKSSYNVIDFAVLYNRAEISVLREEIEYIQQVLSTGIGSVPLNFTDVMNVHVYSYSDRRQSFICPTNVQCLEKDLIGAYNEVLDRIEYSARVGRVIILVTGKDLTPSVVSSLKRVVEAARSSKDVVFNVFMLQYNWKSNDNRILREFGSQNVILVNSTKYLEDISHLWKKQFWKTAFQPCFKFISDRVKISVQMSDESIALDEKAVFDCKADFRNLSVTYQLLRNGVTISPTPSSSDRFVVHARDGETHKIACNVIYPFGLTVTGVTRPYSFIAKPPKNILPDLANAEIERGKDVILLCRRHGRPDAHFYWTKDGKRLAQKPHGEQFGYIIRNTRPSDSGKYICHAKNQAGEAQRIVHFRVV